MTGTPPSRPGRPLAALLAVLLVPLTAGLYLAAPVYNILRVLVKHHPGFRSLHPLDFSKVTNRCMLAVAVLLLVPLVRSSGLMSDLRRALRGDGASARSRSLLLPLFIGLVSMGALYGVGLALGGYRFDPHNELSLRFALGAVCGAAFVGVFEEAFFRGFVFGALNTRLSFWPAAIVGSLFFSSLHFAQPVNFPAPWWADQADAVKLLGLAFNGFDPLRDWPFAITLFLMGLTLCVLYRRQGHLRWCIGLHAGWVLAMQIGQQVCDRDFDRLVWLFTQSGYVGQGLIALPLMALFFVWAVSQPAQKQTPTRKSPIL